MRVIVFVKSTRSSEAGEMPSLSLLEAMTTYNEQLAAAGVMLAGEGLHPSSHGRRIRFSGSDRTVANGPFPATEELVAGYWIWEVGSMDDAVEWARKCPNPMPVDSEIEIRPIIESADFADTATPELLERWSRI